MDDIERYSDYNEYEDDIPKDKKSPVMLILKILVVLVCVAVIGLFAFRMIVYNYYPDSVKNIYFTDTLTAYYNDTDGDICATTQKLRAPYDDPNTGNFFADNLIIIEGVDELQITVRFNRAILDDLSTEYGVELTAENKDAFIFKLTRNHESKDNEFVPIGTLVATKTDSAFMYEYYKLVFDGVDLANGEDNEVKWLALEIYVEGAEMEDPYRIAIYENNSEYSEMKEYKLGGEEHP